MYTNPLITITAYKVTKTQTLFINAEHQYIFLHNAYYTCKYLVMLCIQIQSKSYKSYYFHQYPLKIPTQNSTLTKQLNQFFLLKQAGNNSERNTRNNLTWAGVAMSLGSSNISK